MPASQHQKPLSDIEIAQAAKMRPIVDVARERLGIDAKNLEPYGHYKAKVSLDYIKSLAGKKDGKLILVTAISPTPAGEGKTTTTVGLTDALNFIGYTYAERGLQLEEAERLVRKALELKPDNGFIMDSLGWVLYRRGSFEQAVQTLERALVLSPDEPVILEHLGDAQRKLSNHAGALKNYERALNVNKPGPEADRLRAKIREVKVQLSARTD